MHDFPSTHRDFFIKRLGSERVDQLEYIARSSNKVDKELILKELKEKMKGLCI